MSEQEEIILPNPKTILRAQSEATFEWEMKRDAFSAISLAFCVFLFPSPLFLKRKRKKKSILIHLFSERKQCYLHTFFFFFTDGIWTTNGLRGSLIAHSLGCHEKKKLKVQNCYFKIAAGDSKLRRGIGKY